MTRVSTRDKQRRGWERRDFESASQLRDTFADAGHGAISETDAIVPWVIVNQAGEVRSPFERLKIVSRRFLGRELRLLGEIPRDAAIPVSVSNFLPVVEDAPNSPASSAFTEIARTLDGALPPLVSSQPGRDSEPPIVRRSERAKLRDTNAQVVQPRPTNRPSGH